VVVWYSGSALVNGQRSTSGPVSTEMGERARVQFPVPDISRYATSHRGQLSLAIHSWVGLVSINADSAKSGYAFRLGSKRRHGSCVKRVIPLLHTGHM